jgi:hypothetical protein
MEWNVRTLMHTLSRGTASAMSCCFTLADGGGNAGSNFLSVRPPAPGQSSAMMVAIQHAADWLRLLLLILPTSRLRLPDSGYRSTASHGRIGSAYASTEPNTGGTAN